MGWHFGAAVADFDAVCALFEIRGKGEVFGPHKSGLKLLFFAHHDSVGFRICAQHIVGLVRTVDAKTTAFAHRIMHIALV